MTGYVIEVRGTPAPQGSKRHIGNGRMVEMSKAVGPWREAVRAETMRKAPVPLAGPVRARIRFYVPRPKSHFRTGRYAALLRDGAPGYPSCKPDIDKLCRAVLDGLTMGGAWKDDGQVALLSAVKLYGKPGCMIYIDELGAES